MKTDLIFLHGGPGYTDYLQPYFENQFSSIDFTTTFYTQSQSPDVTVEKLTHELGQHVHSPNTILIGHSWGGVLAVEFLKRTQDERIKGVVLIDSYLCSDHVTLEYKKELSNLGLIQPTWEQIFFTPREREAAQPLLATLQTTLNEPIFHKLWGEFASNFDHRSFASQMIVPLLNVFGDRDIRIPSRVIRSYAQLNPRFQNVEIQEAGHFPFLLEADLRQVVSAIDEFSRELPA